MLAFVCKVQKSFTRTIRFSCKFYDRSTQTKPLERTKADFDGLRSSAFVAVFNSQRMLINSNDELQLKVILESHFETQCLCK